jgi:hypothetical protein
MDSVQSISSPITARGDGDYFLLPIGIPKGPGYAPNKEGTGYIIRLGRKLYDLEAPELLIWHECRKLPRMNQFVPNAATRLSLPSSSVRKILGTIIGAGLLLQVHELDSWNDVKGIRPLPLVDKPEYGGESNGQRDDNLKAHYDLLYDLWLRFDGQTTLEAAVQDLFSESEATRLSVRKACSILLLSLVRTGAVYLNPANEGC